MPTSRIGLVQCEVTDGDAEGNLERLLAMVERAPAVDLLLLPELWTTGYAHARWPLVADRWTPLVTQRLMQLSRERDVSIAGSMISRNDAGELVNRLWLFAPDATPVVYDKGHLFAPMREDEFLVAGRSRVRVPWRGWTLGLSICFDLRFPEMYRLDAVAGADLFLVVAEWPSERSDALRTLARARAIENQAVLALCNRVGIGADDTRFGGGSMIVAPDGAVLVDAGAEAGIFVAEIDRSTVVSLRTATPVFRHRHPSLDGVDGAPSATGG